jgi:hypothetical protein
MQPAGTHGSLLCRVQLFAVCFFTSLPCAIFYRVFFRFFAVSQIFAVCILCYYRVIFFAVCLLADTHGKVFFTVFRGI